jgi:DNA-binding XRE family transcriptional regulator
MGNSAARIEPGTNPDLVVETPVDLTGLLGAAIRERRFFLRISQEELALRAGLHRNYLSDVERGARNPSIKTIEKIAQALDVPVIRLFEQSHVQ